MWMWQAHDYLHPSDQAILPGSRMLSSTCRPQHRALQRTCVTQPVGNMRGLVGPTRAPYDGTVMYRLAPPPFAEVPTDDAYRASRPMVGTRPWVMCNMISSVDGAIAVDGVSGPLGGPSDKEVFSAIRSLADVILVGAGTARAEGYQPPSTSVSSRARRLAAGAWPVPRIAVVSGSLSVDLDLPMFTRQDQRPLVITTADTDPKRLEQVAHRADVIQSGHHTLDLGAALAQLGDLGARVVLSEGGPALNGHLASHDLIDELCLTLAPMAVAGDALGLLGSQQIDGVREFDLAHVLTEDHYLFLRYVRTDRSV